MARCLPYINLPLPPAKKLFVQFSRVTLGVSYMICIHTQTNYFMTALLWKISVFSRLRLKCSSRLDLTFFVSFLFYIFYIFASLYFYIFIFLYFFNEMSLSGGDANSTLALFSQQRHFYVFVYFYFCISVYLQCEWRRRDLNPLFSQQREF